LSETNGILQAIMERPDDLKTNLIGKSQPDLERILEERVGNSLIVIINEDRLDIEDRRTIVAMRMMVRDTSKAFEAIMSKTISLDAINSIVTLV